jgi:hypothetical protein
MGNTAKIGLVGGLASDHRHRRLLRPRRQRPRGRRTAQQRDEILRFILTR